MLGYDWLEVVLGIMQIETRKQIANLTSNILNPFLVGLIVILLLSFESTSSILDALKWSLILIAVGILPVFLVIVYLVQTGGLDSIFTNAREERTKLYLLTGVCVIVSGVILLQFGAPLILVATFIAALILILVFISINLWWKISVHTAVIAALVTILVILYGPIAAVSAVLLPLIAWARIKLRHHSLAQVTTGALLATLIVVVVFSFLGLV